MDSQENAPTVFISYSHDSPAHRKWVGELASGLVQNGVDAILDQWHLGLGDDVVKFMENGVTKADRVLMICTEPYVRKADAGTGGVGYEAMIVTAQLIKNFETSKFIPIIRQKSGSALLPKAVSTRSYVDFGEDQDFGTQFELLLRELHQVRALQKPPLGRNPFVGEGSSVESGPPRWSVAPSERDAEPGRGEPVREHALPRLELQNARAAYEARCGGNGAVSSQDPNPDMWRSAFPKEAMGLLEKPDKTADDVIALADMCEVDHVEFWFVDILGELKSFGVNGRQLRRVFDEGGIGFDGSKVEGFTPVEKSDVIATPDASTFVLLPWRKAGRARMFCDILSPIAAKLILNDFLHSWHGLV